MSSVEEDVELISKEALGIYLKRGSTVIDGKDEESPLQLQSVDLEPAESYVKKVRADVTRSKANAAIWVTVILAVGMVVSLPIYLIAILLVENEQNQLVAQVFGEWYRTVSPILAAAVGALLGVSLATAEK